jgi:hypothetical protein
MTCCIGESIGLGGRYFFWEQIKPRARAFRWYGVKKSFYGVQHHIYYKGILPFLDMLRAADDSFATPYWVVLPGLGGTQHEAYFQVPYPAQTAALMHLCAANRADGQLWYTYQELVHPVTFRDRREGLMQRIGEAAGWIQQNAELLVSLEVGGADVRCKSPSIEPVPLHNDAGEKYVYAVNRNTREPVSCRLFWPRSEAAGRVKDLFEGKERTVDTDEFYRYVDLELRAGDGRLLALGR